MPNTDFVDYVKLHLTSGAGGSGSMHFRREKFVEKGGPDGGNGGKGGSIIMRGDHSQWTLINLKYRKHIDAENGGNGRGALCTGADAQDIILNVPLGTIAKKAETGEVVGEITVDGEEVVILPGGRGGMGNTFFKTATRQTPRFAQPGEPGQEGWFILELKILADVGLVGFPNAGKSTLLSSISAAHPKIADYPFTTLEPSIGIVKYYDEKSFVMADIPGIIEGAHEGKGLGYRFLRHIERNSILLFMVSAENLDISKEYKVLLNELKEYNPQLLDKERILAVTKCDLLDKELEKEIKKHLPKKVPYVFISSVTGEGLKELKDIIWESLQK
ncbi:MAG: GTPase ObgE [Bacteroidales bacterium]|jgi:GTPase|nr:GTPase ObgE [Bacteroidales bacterium]MCI1733216.1 GTPase ObgE [Bacteroidales bacterium]